MFDEVTKNCLTSYRKFTQSEKFWRVKEWKIVQVYVCILKIIL